MTLTSYSIDTGAPISVPSSATAPTFTTVAVTFNQPHILVFSAVAQYQVAFQFFDSLGRNTIEPSTVELGIGNSTVDVQGPSVWLANGTSFSVVNVTWEGAGVGPTPPPSFQVKEAPLNVTLDTKVYGASLKVVDLFGLPVSGAQVSMSLANGTTVTGTTKGDGTFSVAMIPLGTFSAKVSSLGMSAHIAGDAASGPQVAEGKVPLSVIALFVIVAAAVAAGSSGVLVQRRRRGKARVSAQK